MSNPSSSTVELVALLDALRSRGVARYTRGDLSVEFFPGGDLEAHSGLTGTPPPFRPVEPPVEEAASVAVQDPGAEARESLPTDGMTTESPVRPHNPFAGLPADDALFDSAGKGV